jgi:hypothetical protein
VTDAATARSNVQKKSISAAEQTRQDVAAACDLWRCLQQRLIPERLVFLDETWTKTNMTPLRCRARRGERVLGETLSLLSGPLRSRIFHLRADRRQPVAGPTSAILSCNLKEVCDERGLPLHVTTADVVNLPLPDHRHCFVAQASPNALSVEGLAQQCW